MATDNNNKGQQEIGKNQIQQTQKIFQTIFDPLHIFSTKRNLKSDQKDKNGTMKST